METKRFIIDTDCGIDDIQALFISLKFLNVIGITTVAGNVPLEQVNTNVAKVLQIWDQRVPIIPGASAPLWKNYEDATSYHGKDGLGDSEEIDKIEGFTDWISTTQTAAEYILEQSKEPGLEIICIGPLTNIAISACLDSTLKDRIGNLYIMGGTLYGKGNIAPNKEYNFNYDPEATAKIINNFKNMHIIPWEAWIDLKVPKEFSEKVYQSEEPKVKFFAEANLANYKKMGILEICDGFAAVVAVDPTLCTESHELIAEAYTDGSAAGQISYMWENYCFAFKKENINCKVYHKFNTEGVLDLLSKSLEE